MLRYCFILQKPGDEDIIKEYYKDVITTYDMTNNSELCLTINQTNVSKFKKLDKYLFRPRFTPNWKTISNNNGPFITEEHYVQKNKYLTNKKTGQLIPISKAAEIALLTYLDYKPGLDYKYSNTYFFGLFGTNRDVQYEKTFQTYFEKLTGKNLTDLDLDPYKSISLTVPQPDPEKYRYVTIDGKRIELETYGTPMTTVVVEGEDRGKIKLGITRKDILLNSPDRVSGFNTVFHPGSSWAYKWENPFYGETYICMNFEEEEETEEYEYAHNGDITDEKQYHEIENSDMEGKKSDTIIYEYNEKDLFGEMSEDDETEVDGGSNSSNREIDYGEDEEEEEDRLIPSSRSNLPFTLPQPPKHLNRKWTGNEFYQSGINDEPLEEEEVYHRKYQRKYQKIPKWIEEVTKFSDSSLKQDFKTLNASERYLPLSFVLSPTEQWKIIEKAILSNFKRIDDLPKISDYHLSFAANVMTYAIQKGNVVPKAVYSIIEYANKRRV